MVVRVRVEAFQFFVDIFNKEQVRDFDRALKKK
jgi:hypothetical protein